MWSTDSLASIKLADLDVICAVLGCEVGELLIPEPEKVTRPVDHRHGGPLAAAASGEPPGPQAQGRGRTLAAAGLMGGISPGKPATSCAECFAWGVLAGHCCRACYTFRNLHPSGRCTACQRTVPIKDGYCRLCRLHVLDDAKAAGKTAVSEPFLRRVRCQQLFFARQHRGHYRIPGRARLGKHGTRGQRPTPMGAELRDPPRGGGATPTPARSSPRLPPFRPPEGCGPGQPHPHARPSRRPGLR